MHLTDLGEVLCTQVTRFSKVFTVFTKVMAIVSPGLSVMLVKGILTSQQKIVSSFL